MIKNIDKGNKYKKILILFFFLFFLFMGAGAVRADKVMDGLNKTAEVGLGDELLDTTPSLIIGRVIGIGLSFIAILFFGLLIYGGFNWMTARGNEDEAKKAMDLIQAAVFGLIIVLIAYAVTAFLTSAFVQNAF